MDYDWKFHNDLCGSDHFPILLNNIGPENDEPVSRWKLNKANWTQFQTPGAARLLEDTVQKADDPIESFASTLINTVKLQWLEHWWLFYHGCFELVLESLGKIPLLQIRDNLG